MISKIDESRDAAFAHLDEHVIELPCVTGGMSNRRPRVLVMLRPPLLADLVRRALVAEGVDAALEPGHSRWQGWDVTVVGPRDTIAVRTRYVVVATDEPSAQATSRRTFVMRGSDFSSLLALVRRLCRS